MPADKSAYRTNHWRRSLGIVFCLIPFGLAASSCVVGFANGNWAVAGLGVAVGGFLFSVCNVYLSFVRPWRYSRRHTSMEGYRFVSGAPVIGTLCVVVSNIMGFGEIITGTLGLVTLVLDTGGSPWFLVSTWNDRSMWDTQAAKSDTVS